jgi:hypothetical protein
VLSLARWRGPHEFLTVLLDQGLYYLRVHMAAPRMWAEACLAMIDTIYLDQFIIKTYLESLTSRELLGFRAC